MTNVNCVYSSGSPTRRNMDSKQESWKVCKAVGRLHCLQVLPLWPGKLTLIIYTRFFCDKSVEQGYNN